MHVDMTPPLTPATKCSYLIPERKLNVPEDFGSDDIVVIFPFLSSENINKNI